MPIHVSWDNEEKTIIRSENEGKWTWDDYHASLDQIVAMINDVGHRVDIISVDRRGALMPSGSLFSHYKRAARILPSNTGLNISVTKNSFAKAMAATFEKLPRVAIPNSFKMVASLNEAYALIAQDRAENAPVEES